jgi:cytochrome c biogenesis protein CcdA/thiol-disulfide isomerase/thioredoxin
MFVILFIAGLLTILLPCILPLVPIVLGVSIAGRSKLRPLVATLGMVVGFVAIVFVLHVLLRQFPSAADTVRIATYVLLFLFGVGFTVSDVRLARVLALLSGLFLVGKGWFFVALAAVVGLVAMEIGGRIAGTIQQFGADVQRSARERFGSESLLATFCIGLTMGFVWVPCAGPALGFVFALVREQPGATAFALVAVYALGAAVPLLLLGYGGQFVLRSARSLATLSGTIERAAGVVLILTAIALRMNWFVDLQTWAVQRSSYGRLGSMLEERLFGERTSKPKTFTERSVLPAIAAAPEFMQLGPWHNSAKLTLAEFRGKVVLVDFWTYSCINCIRTLPYIEGYWRKFKDTGKFILLGVHTPEFAFEQNPRNVSEAIKRHGLTYPIAQDNEYGTWNAFANRYWPAKYLIDAEGIIRYAHFGEGAYKETEEAIMSLLKEAGVAMSDQRSAIPTSPRLRGASSDQMASNRNRSPETYLGTRSWDQLGNAQGEPSGQIITYTIPAKLILNNYYLGGDWQLVNNEKQVLHSDTGEIRMKFLGTEANLVLGMSPGTNISADVYIDGAKTKTITIDYHDLYNLFSGPYGEHDLRLVIRGRGLEGYAFTFGS